MAQPARPGPALLYVVNIDCESAEAVCCSGSVSGTSRSRPIPYEAVQTKFLCAQIHLQVCSVHELWCHCIACIALGMMPALGQPHSSLVGTFEYLGDMPCKIRRPAMHLHHCMSTNLASQPSSFPANSLSVVRAAWFKEPASQKCTACRHNKRKDDLFIFDDQTGNATAASAVAAASTSQNEDLLRQGQEMVMFPGVNAPAPPGADARLWVGTLHHELPASAGVMQNNLLTVGPSL